MDDAYQEKAILIPGIKTVEADEPKVAEESAAAKAS